jgi:hypothetical protein
MEFLLPESFLAEFPIQDVRLHFLNAMNAYLEHVLIPVHGKIISVSAKSFGGWALYQYRVVVNFRDLTSFCFNEEYDIDFPEWAIRNPTDPKKVKFGTVASQYSNFETNYVINKESTFDEDEDVFALRSPPFEFEAQVIPPVVNYTFYEEETIDDNYDTEQSEDEEVMSEPEPEPVTSRKRRRDDDDDDTSDERYESLFSSRVKLSFWTDL